MALYKYAYAYYYYYYKTTIRYTPSGVDFKPPCDKTAIWV